MLENFLADTSAPVSINRLGSAVETFFTRDREAFDQLAGVPSTDCTEDEADAFKPAVYRGWAIEAAKARKWILGRTHDTYRRTCAGEVLFPKDVTCGAVYLVRNPLDVAVSSALFFGHRDFSRAIANMADDTAALGGPDTPGLRERLSSWSRHVEIWRGAPIPVLTVRYEDLSTDPVGQLRRITQFLRLDHADDARLQRAVMYSDFSSLQKNEAREGFREGLPSSRFFRAGKTDTWRHSLSTAQVREVVRTHERLMLVLGYDPHGTFAKRTAFLPAPKDKESERLEIVSTTRLRRTGISVEAMVDDELVLMHVADGALYSLDEAGAQTWKLIDEDGSWVTVDALIVALCERYEVDTATCLRDVAVLLDELNAAGLIELVDD